jgi:hypothetical protein
MYKLSYIPLEVNVFLRMRVSRPNTDIIVPRIKDGYRQTLKKIHEMIFAGFLKNVQSIALFLGLILETGLAPPPKKSPIRLARCFSMTTHTAVSMTQVSILKLGKFRVRVWQGLVVVKVPAVLP